MPFTTQQLDFLNRGFLATSWPHIADIVSNEVLQCAWEGLDEAGFKLYLSGSSVEMKTPPKFTLSDSTLRMMAPASGFYGAHLDFGKPNVIDYTLGVRIAVDFMLGAGPPQPPVVKVEPDGGLLDEIVFLLGRVRSRVKDKFGEHLGMFNTVRFAPEVAVSIPEPELLTVNRDIGLRGIDIVLVADGFTKARMHIFTDFAAAFTSILTTSPPPTWLEPLASFSSVVRVWKIQSLCGNPQDPLRWVSAHYPDTKTQTEKTSVANVARLAALGVAAETVGAELVVFIGDAEQFRTVSFVQDGQSPLGEPRPSCVGRLIFEPVNEGEAESNARTLVHEIGHSILAGLADEYIEDNLKTTSYRGKEPAAPNVTAEIPSANSPSKWVRWTNNPNLLPAWDTQEITSPEGARYYGRGLWRPAASCRMNKNGPPDIPFCAVCREAFTRSMRAVIGEEYLLLEYAYPSRGEVKCALVTHPDPQHNLVHRIRIPEGQLPIAVSAKVVACSLPKPWVIGCALIGSGIVNSREEIGCTFTPRFDDTLVITIDSLCPFTPWDTLPTYRLRLRCDLPLRDIPQAAPSAPKDLRQRRHSAGWLKPWHVVLSAAAEDPNADDIRLEFELAEEAEAFTGEACVESEWREWTRAHPIVRAEVEEILSSGRYKFRARAVDTTNRRSAWSDTVNFSVPEIPVP